MSDVIGHAKAPSGNGYDDKKSLSAREIADFLREHPDFFARHAELLEDIRIPHVQKGSVSLVEVQSEQLRKKVRQLNYRLSQLISIAKQNEKIYRVYTDLNVQLLTCQSVAEIQLRLEEVLQEKLDLASVTLKLFKGPHALPELQRRLFVEKRFKNEPFFFGRLSQHERQLLFGDEVAESAALILIGNDEPLGIAAIGSSDVSHFTPDMDTLLLKQLQQVLSFVLPGLLKY
ncbi:DUF484 family protein [Salinimonas sp. HHU 13199]|uniref:DUF484 family protein n=1 Tax=Salinimonas profundi TaxID=2729140 RepID=A0ABR8LJX6_9ALTE|nr:DUF484 family protein [Salinimonas profundi]MBD3586503.1 DUF484 family protein [Salinimonas profundi]